MFGIQHLRGLGLGALRKYISNRDCGTILKKEKRCYNVGGLLAFFGESIGFHVFAIACTLHIGIFNGDLAVGAGAVHGLQLGDHGLCLHPHLLVPHVDGCGVQQEVRRVLPLGTHVACRASIGVSAGPAQGQRRASIGSAQGQHRAGAGSA